MFGLIISILGFILGPLFKVMKSLFVLPPEEVQRREDAKKMDGMLNAVADPDAKPYVLLDNAKQDIFGSPSNSP